MRCDVGNRAPCARACSPRNRSRSVFRRLEGDPRPAVPELLRRGGDLSDVEGLAGCEREADRVRVAPYRNAGGVESLDVVLDEDGLRHQARDRERDVADVLEWPLRARRIGRVRDEVLREIEAGDSHALRLATKSDAVQALGVVKGFELALGAAAAADDEHDRAYREEPTANPHLSVSPWGAFEAAIISASRSRRQGWRPIRSRGGGNGQGGI